MVVKSQVMVSVDSTLLERIREKNENLSGILNNHLREYLEKDGTTYPEQISKAKRELEETQNKAQEINDLIKRLDEKYAQEQIQLKAAADKIEREIRNFPTFIKNGFLSTQGKRERYFKQRANLLNIPIEDYLKEVVEKAAQHKE